jgi:hypothetical protein
VESEAQSVIDDAVIYITDMVMVNGRMSPAARDLLNAAMYERGDFSRGAMAVVLREDYIPHLSVPEDTRNHNLSYRKTQVPINGADFTGGASSLSDVDPERAVNYAPCMSSADSNGMVQSLNYVNSVSQTVQVPRRIEVTPTSCRTQTSSSGKRSLSEMYNVGPTATVDSKTSMPKIRNWETHLELGPPPDAFSQVDQDMTDFVRVERVFKLYQSVAGTSSSSGSSESGVVAPKPDEDY